MDSNQEQQEIAEIRELIRNKALRSTNARITVIQKLKNASSPISHAELADLLEIGRAHV